MDESIISPRAIAAAGLCVLALSAPGCADRRPPTLAASNDNQASGVALHDYRCASGATVRAAYPTRSTALVRYQGKIHEMHIARSADGARYVGPKQVWWTKGSGPGASATLFARAANGATGAERERCREVGSG